MNRYISICMLLGVVVILSSAVLQVNKSSGPPSCNAGEPPNTTNCTGCHADYALNSGTAAVSLNLGEAENGYEPGKVYTISVIVNKPGMKRAGFQSIVLQDQNNKISPGTISLTEPNRTQLLDKNSPHSGGCLEEERVWIEHTYNGISSSGTGESKWSYLWKAPDTSVGPVTFYLAALQADNDLTESGDYVYTLKKTLNSLPLSLARTNNKSLLKIYFSQSDQSIHVEYSQFVPKQVILNELSGKEIEVWKGKDFTVQNKMLILPVTDIKPGIYILSLSDGEQVMNQKVIIQ
jgi:hypothetical protein